MLTAFVAFLTLAFLVLARCLRRRAMRRPPSRKHLHPTPSSRTVRHPPKPPWVRSEVIRLKALMPHSGCRKIAHTFNHLHGQRRAMTVGKSYVASVLRESQLEVVRRRREIKHRIPRSVPSNLLWAVDLTEVRDGQGGRHRVLGLIDHGSRACLALREIRTKASIEILRQLLDAIERFGRPKVLRTDNEPCFTSRLLRFGLWLLGIHHRPIAPFAPWQNGRIERLFRTVKEAWRLREVCTSNRSDIQPDLDLIRFWYNHARPHQHLRGRTPAMAWAGMDAPQGRGQFVSAWSGALAGYYFKA